MSQECANKKKQDIMRMSVNFFILYYLHTKWCVCKVVSSMKILLSNPRALTPRENGKRMPNYVLRYFDLKNLYVSSTGQNLQDFLTTSNGGQYATLDLSYILYPLSLETNHR